ncbi:MAG: ABC transporter substrate-binding protein [Acetobacteraceae bacterium]|nr:ABC transporter substrate-binding protein [Acetobacteraceae bacterium]
MILSRRRFGQAAAAGLLTAPRIGRAAEPITIGMIVPMTGAGAEPGKLSVNGASLALAEVNKDGVLDRPLRIVMEDDQTSNPGTVLAFSRLAGHAEIAAFIGPVRSTQVKAIAPDVLRTGKPMMFGGSDPSLTQAGNPWLFRCRPHDGYSAKVMAEYGSKDLGGRKWAVIHTTDTFGTNGSKALKDELEARGTSPVLVEGFTNGMTDFSAVILALRQSGADLLVTYFSLDPDLAIFARQLRELGVHVTWLGSAAIANTSARKLAGSALHGTYGVADFAAEANPVSRSLAARYETAFTQQPDQNAAWVYDAIHLLARAIRDTGGMEPERVRAALLAIRGHAGAEGEYNFDPNGDGLHGYNVVRNDAGTLVFVRRVEFPSA